MMQVALSGGIASGKTTVSNQFEALGVPVIDADVLARVAVEPASPGLQAIVKRFGDQVLLDNGELNRKALRQIIFNDSDARSDLETIIHPQVRLLTQAQLSRHRKNGAVYCVVVIPLLVETNQQQSYDHIIIVDVDQQTQINRLLKRDDTTLDQAKKILASQAGRQQRLDIADDVITNNGSLEDIEAQVQQLHEKLVKMAFSYNSNNSS